MSPAARFEVRGIVQGVGFRPFVYRLATGIGLAGIVGNDTAKVFIEVAGPPTSIDEFARRLRSEAPPLARIESIERTTATERWDDGFRIVASVESDEGRTLVPPDTATCRECVTELLDPSDRRFLHPFITCTNCGPRFTIITGLPYDRPSTTMADFPMCPACRSEYEDPADRRYHAQPISCHDCGPRLTLRVDGAAIGEAPIEAAVRLLADGKVVAIKGIGGYHLVGDATDDGVLARLRERKRRPDKPFAVMVSGLDQAGRCGEIDDAEAWLLESPERPIVLVRASAGSGLSVLVAPGNPLVGLMLPYAPVHHLLFRLLDRPLVMTSANVGGSPIVHRDDPSVLEPMSDAILSHDRGIHVPCDDSVVRVVRDRLLPIRRSRGYAPIPVDVDLPRSVLALGGELKNTVCVASTDRAWMSQHIGDLENLETLEAFEASIALVGGMYQVQPEVVAIDPHPGYLSSNWARRNRGAATVAVQHHHAHVMSVVAEHGLDPTEPVLGFAFDGTGFGSDDGDLAGEQVRGEIWGGEVLAASAFGFRRVAHLAPVLLPGGDAAVLHPARAALAHLHTAGIDWDPAIPAVGAVTADEHRNLRRQMETGFGCVTTTSMGRLFDAVASVIGVRHRITYEAQAAIELEIAAADGADRGAYPLPVDGGVIELRQLWASVLADVEAGVPVADIARKFHVGVADAVVSIAQEERGSAGVVLSGGVFQNALLTGMCLERLEGAGIPVFTHHRVPPNDGGLSLGQAVVGAFAIRA